MAQNTQISSRPGFASTGAQGPAQNKKKQTGTGFVNLSQFKKANDPTQLGGVLSGNVQSGAQKSVEATQQGQQQFEQQKQQEQQRLSGVKQGATNALNQIISGTGEPQTTDQDVQAYSQFAGAQYQGPQNLQDVQSLQARQASAAQNAKMLGSQGGQQQLLRSAVGTPQYGANLQNLDAVLLGGNKQVQQDLRTARQQALQKLASNDVNALSNLNQQRAQLAAQDLQTSQKGLQKQASDFGTGVNEAVTARTAELQAQQAQKRQALQSALEAGEITADQAQLLGLDASADQVEIGNLGAQDIFGTTQAADINRSNAISNVERSKLQALSRLTGNDAFTSGLDLNAQSLDPSKLISGQGDKLNELLQGSRQQQDAQAGATGVNENLWQELRNENRAGINLGQNQLAFNAAGRGQRYLGTNSLDQFIDSVDAATQGKSLDEAKQAQLSARERVNQGLQKAQQDLQALQPQLVRDSLGRIANPAAAEQASYLQQIIGTLGQLGNNLEGGANRFQSQRDAQRQALSKFLKIKK